MSKDDQYLRNKIAEHEEFVARARASRRVDRLSTDDYIAQEVTQINEGLLLAQTSRAEEEARQKQAKEDAMRAKEANKEGA